jgi:hypothetical protein
MRLESPRRRFERATPELIVLHAFGREPAREEIAKLAEAPAVDDVVE